MIDLQKDLALARRFLTFVGLAPLLIPLIHKSEQEGGSGKDKLARVMDGIEVVVGALIRRGFMPPDYLNDPTARKEIVRVNNALVAGYNESGTFEQKQHQQIAADLPAQGEDETDEAYNARIETEFQKRQAEADAGAPSSATPAPGRMTQLQREGRRT